MNNLKIKILIVYVVLLVLFGIFLVPMTEELGIITTDQVIVLKQSFLIRPIWTQMYLATDLPGTISYTQLKTNEFSYISLILITLACSASYIALKKT
ncbi:MAG: hypothetical protein COA82_07525 [Alkaliphilus sp.]|nr:hypothetical protein [Alkaliphilus transvaalensis]PHS34218.1 MAG: hypothetical protein COA82_07525 [Alkaliphilus sp.]